MFVIQLQQFVTEYHRIMQFSWQWEGSSMPFIIYKDFMVLVAALFRSMLAVLLLRSMALVFQL